MNRKLIRWSALAILGAWGCSGNNNTTPPPSGSAVGSVTVAPTSVAMNVAATQQLTATVRDTAGAVMSGVTITWASSSPTVATVSSSGLVTAVSAGTAAVTATVEGKSGQSTITVVSNQYGPVLSTVQIGSSGGTLGTSDVAVTIPSGALTGTSTIKLIQDTMSGVSFPGNGASPLYYITGLPTGVTVQLRVRIKPTGTNSGTSALGSLVPAFQEGDPPSYVLGTTLFPASDSSGYLVATIPVTGRGTPASVRTGGAITGARLFDPSLLAADAGVMAMLNLSHATSSASHFDLWGWAGTDAVLQPKLALTGQVAEQAYTTLVGMNYDMSFRTWPVQVFVNTPVAANGLFSLLDVPPWPPNLSKSNIQYNKNYTANIEYPGVVIHELFHLVKSNVLPINTYALWWSKNWLDEATSTWIQEKAPGIYQPYTDSVALWLRDSLYSGFSAAMVGYSGYGKAPIIKYIAKTWGDGKVREILNASHGAAEVITPFFATIPSAVKTWWPDLLVQNMTRQLYPWVDSMLVPKHRYNDSLTLGLGRFDTDFLNALAVEGEFIKRDTSRFGPNFVLPIRLDSVDRGHGTIIAFQKTAGVTGYRLLSQGDSVMIPGTLLQSKDSLLLLVTRTEATAPYGDTRFFTFMPDLQLPPADWYFPTISALANSTHFTCDKPGASVTMAMDTNATEIWSFLAGAGTWKLTASGPGKSQTHTWTPAPGMSDSLAKYHVTATSTMVTGQKGDTIHANARFILDWSGGGPGGTGGTPSGASWWWLVIPAGALPLAFRRRTRALGLALVGISLLVFTACEAGQINLKMDETFTYTFTKMRFTANPLVKTDPLMQVYQGSGQTTINSYQSVYWDYITDNTGAKTDSVKVTCTGSGTATYKVDGTAMKDSVTLPASLTLPSASAMRSLLGRTTPRLEQYLKLVRP